MKVQSNHPSPPRPLAGSWATRRPEFPSVPQPHRPNARQCDANELLRIWSVGYFKAGLLHKFLAVRPQTLLKFIGPNLLNSETHELWTNDRTGFSPIEPPKIQSEIYLDHGIFLTHDQQAGC